MAGRLVALLAGPAAVFALLSRFGGEALWLVELLRYLPFPVHLLPTILAVAVSCWLGWAWRLFSLMALAAVCTLTMGLAWGEPDEGHGRLRVMTYNIKAYLAQRQPRNWPLIAAEVAWHAPDVLVLQDARYFADSNSTALRAAGVIPANHESVAMGQYVVSSRYPLRDCRFGDMSFRRFVHQYVHCSILVDKRTIDVITLHLLSPRDGLEAARNAHFEGLDEWRQNYLDRLTQARAVSNAVQRVNRPIIVAGDLNAAEQSPVAQLLLNSGLRDTHSSAGFGYGYTVGHALRPGVSFLRLDHILVSPEWGIASSEVGGKYGSEHRPVIADLLLHKE